MMSSQDLLIAVTKNLEERKTSVRVSQEHYFDLTDGETTEAYIFRAPINLELELEVFVTTAVWKMMEHLGLNYDDLLSAAKDLNIYALDSWPTLNSNPLKVLQIYPKYDISIPELNTIQYLYGIEIGPCSVQEFYIARTPSEYVSLYWYTTG